jgi:hypothetical protein
MNDSPPILPVDAVLHNAHALAFNGSYALAVIGVGLLSAALLYGAELWGAARARRRTARAIAAIERSGPPEART